MILKTVFSYSRFQYLKLQSFPNQSGVHLSKFVSLEQISSPKLRKRFVDDTFVIMQTNEVNRFFDHLNNVDPNINLTIELEQDDKLAFLDVLVMRTQDGKLATKVHRKTTHTNRYLNYFQLTPLNKNKVW